MQTELMFSGARPDSLMAALEAMTWDDTLEKKAEVADVLAMCQTGEEQR